MPLLQRIIEHFLSLVLVSDLSMKLMGVSIIIMSVAYVYFIITKKNNYENIIVKIGILVRILMIIGFTIEFSHQKAICGDSIRIGLKYNSVEQFSNFLFYGYIFVIGIYDIFTIGINKFRGFFHAFDLTIISMPILYLCTAFILSFNIYNDIIRTLLMLGSLILLPFMFFNLYWKQNLKWYSIFLGYIILQLIIYKVLRTEILFSSTLVSYFLIGSYELGRHIFHKAKSVSTISLWKKLRALSIVVPVTLIYFIVIALNISPIEIEKKYYIDSVYRNYATFTSLQEAENLARIALEDETSKISHWQGKTEDFNNRYNFSLGDYSVDIDGATGKIFEIRNQKEKDMKSDKNLSEKDIENKTLKWLKTVGFTYDENHHVLRVGKRPNSYEVSIYNKSTDGFIYDRNVATIQWDLDGKLQVAGFGTFFSNFKDYKDVKINEEIIDQRIKQWYAKLGEAIPHYGIVSYLYWFGEFDPSIHVECGYGDSFFINSFSGEILKFTRTLKREVNFNSQLNDSIFDKHKSKAEQLAKKLSNNYKEGSYILKENSSMVNLSYEFVEKDKEVPIVVTIQLDEEGNLIFFSESHDYRSKLYSDKEFNISSSRALRLVSKEYRPLSIYAKRVKLVVEFKDNGDINYKWMVVIIPFKKADHQIYYVDANTGDITPLLNYNE